MNESFSFISEDDLPEWLRALGDDDLGATPQTNTTTSFATQHTSQPAFTPTVPAVSRAWLTRVRSVDPMSAESVSNDFTPLETPDRPSTIEPPSSPTQDTAVHAAIDRPTGEPRQKRGQSKRMSLVLLVAVLLVLIAVVAYFALGNLL